MVALLFFGLWFAPYADRRGIAVLADNEAQRWVGLALFTLGLGLIYWSGMALGRLYSPEVTLQKDHHLVTDGPYRWIRHPRYLGGILLALGLAGLFRSIVGLGLVVVYVVPILWRIRDEEAMMAREFGQEWAAYCQRTSRLIPYLF